ncbi:hypothetical protein AB9P05_20675 [Roseivirga sp. BDSF3-8]|uniref:hypothetical protein n=1 Tax=Roseivirga sp. BDSF3-8 TaxID=3241598 RepID=UPI003531E14A
MNKSKKILLAAFIVFILVVIAIMWDMSRKTTFPGQRDTETQPPDTTLRLSDTALSVHA